MPDSSVKRAAACCAHGEGSSQLKGIRNAAPVPTIAFSIGQILGPLIAVPTLHSGYATALLLGAGIVALAAAAALPIRTGHRAWADPPA